MRPYLLQRKVVSPTLPFPRKELLLLVYKDHIVFKLHFLYPRHLGDFLADCKRIRWVPVESASSPHPPEKRGGCIVFLDISLCSLGVASLLSTTHLAPIDLEVFVAVKEPCDEHEVAHHPC